MIAALLILSAVAGCENSNPRPSEMPTVPTHGSEPTPEPTPQPLDEGGNPISPVSTAPPKTDTSGDENSDAEDSNTERFTVDFTAVGGPVVKLEMFDYETVEDLADGGKRAVMDEYGGSRQGYLEIRFLPDETVSAIAPGFMDTLDEIGAMTDYGTVEFGDGFARYLTAISASRESETAQISAWYSAYLIQTERGVLIAVVCVNPLSSSGTTVLLPEIARTMTYEYPSSDTARLAGEISNAAIKAEETPTVPVNADDTSAAEIAVGDRLFEEQWNLHSIRMSEAWDFGLYGQGARVAVIDSGINAGHEDFEGVDIADGINLLDGSADVSDNTGHGSAIAGIIAGKRGNGTGVAGMADQVTIVPIKCFDNSAETDVDYIIAAIYLAVDELSCDVINLSLCIEYDLPAFKEAIDYAVSRNVFVIAAAGNNGNSTLMYPAAYDGVISVGSYGTDGLYCDFSHYDVGVFVSAPGEEIITTGHKGADSYLNTFGSSFSAPHVTALAAIAKSQAPEMSLDEFKRLLIESASGGGAYDARYGYGKIDAAAFAELLTVRGTEYADELVGAQEEQASVFDTIWDRANRFLDMLAIVTKGLRA